MLAAMRRSRGHCSGAPSGTVTLQDSLLVLQMVLPCISPRGKKIHLYTKSCSAWAGGMAQWLRVLGLYEWRPEFKSPSGMVACICPASGMSKDRKIPRTRWPVSLTETVSSRFGERLFQEKMLSTCSELHMCFVQEYTHLHILMCAPLHTHTPHLLMPACTGKSAEAWLITTTLTSGKLFICRIPPQSWDWKPGPSQPRRLSSPSLSPFSSGVLPWRRWPTAVHMWEASTGLSGL